MKPIYQGLPFPDTSLINCYKEELPRFIVPWHHHPQIEIMHILSGKGTRFVGDHIGRYEEGDTCLIGPHIPHEWRSDKTQTAHAACHCIFFMKDIFEKNLIYLPEMRNIQGLLEQSQRGIRFTGDTRRTLGEPIGKLMSARGAARITGLISLLEQMATQENYELLTHPGYMPAGSLSDDFDRFNKIHQYIAEHFSRPITLNEIASYTGLTPSAFCRYFVKRTKKTFVRYLNDMRIGHAKKLLMESNRKIADISQESGFNNLSHFIEQFKRSVHMSPSEYQKTFGKKNLKLL